MSNRRDFLKASAATVAGAMGIGAAPVVLASHSKSGNEWATSLLDVRWNEEGRLWEQKTNGASETSFDAFLDGLDRSESFLHDLDLSAKPSHSEGAFQRIGLVLSKPIADEINRRMKMLPFQWIDACPSGRIDFSRDFFDKDDQYDESFTMPNHGYIPQKILSKNSIVCDTYQIGHSIEMLPECFGRMSWPMFKKVIKRDFIDGIVRKIESDMISVLVAAAYYRDIVVTDNMAPTDTFTPRLWNLMKNVMAQYQGSRDRFAMTTAYVSGITVDHIQETWNGCTKSTDKNLLNVQYSSSFTERQKSVIRQLFDLSVMDIGLSKEEYEEKCKRRMIEIERDWFEEFGSTNDRFASFRSSPFFGIDGFIQNFYNIELKGSLPSGAKEIVLGIDEPSIRENCFMPTRGSFDVSFEMNDKRMRMVTSNEIGLISLTSRNVILGAY